MKKNGQNGLSDQNGLSGQSGPIKEQNNKPLQFYHTGGVDKMQMNK